MTERNTFFDTLRGLLITLVIFGHALEPFHAIVEIRALYLLIYSFHMPLFIAVSGYFGSKPFELTKAFRKLLLPLIIFHFLYIGYATVIGDTIHRVAWDRPFWSLWFLWALFVWQFMASISSRIPLRYQLVTAVLVSLVVGLFHQVGYPLSLSRILFFYPWYLFGKIIRKKMWESVTLPINSAIAALVMLGLYWVALAYNSIDIRWFFGSVSYQNLNAEPLPGIVGRAAVYCIQSIMVVLVLAIVPRKHVGFITQAGKDTLPLFLGHGIVLLPISVLFTKEIARLYHPGLVLIHAALITLFIMIITTAIMRRLKRFKA